MIIVLISAAIIIAYHPPPSPWFFVGVLMAVFYGTMKMIDEKQAKQDPSSRDDSER
ncbi:MAG: hypothetical protein IBX50_18205 [Marinospirillum sp.]|uniref:hypothetical protein n=1 Tax=Marinospirillum sp. TaxID=2183934 RepID=UPI0019F35D47|nr:hypothetical protein [Marinospirillum sp.]MBE0508620.1 hypothetical protein [Marinospirillum sp.]